jgi:hypothetical protein
MRVNFFVCISIRDNKLVSKIIPASSSEEAGKLFHEQVDLFAQEIHGPFHKVRKQILENTRVLKFSDNTPYKAIYNDWLVNAFKLEEPVNHAYLIFIKRTDDKKVPFPKGTITAPISDLRFIKDEK